VRVMEASSSLSSGEVLRRLVCWGRYMFIVVVVVGRRT
jgi:hypothetical protein